VAYDTRNNRLDPSSGFYFSSSAEFAGLGGRVFQKYLLTGRAYRKLFWKFVARTNLEYGLLANSLTGETVPDAERFILGGIFSLRGFTQNSVGPSKRITPTRRGAPTTPIDYVVGGTQKLVFNQEIEFPLIPEADIRAALFFDAGNTWDPGRAITGPAVLANYGWGIRWYSPLGPLRFEWGFPISRRAGDKGSDFNFIIAPTF
jgi:outer membrane protein insertion porin family